MVGSTIISLKEFGNDCQKIGESTCACAGKNGHLDCLIYAHENGCSWNSDTCEYAAYNGHLKCLTYAHENGCHWDETTCSNAAGNGQG